METFVRGARIEAFLDASSKVDRALRAGAMAVLRLRVRNICAMWTHP
jgi:hypothetical protein